MKSDPAAAQAGEVPENESVDMTSSKYLKYIHVVTMASYKSSNGALYLGNKDIDVKFILHTNLTTN